MTDLTCYITTFNCGRNLISIDHFAASLFDGLKTNLPPDLVVLCLEEIAPIAYSFLGLTAPFLARFSTAINLAAAGSFEGAKYERVAGEEVGLTAILVYAREGVKEQIRWITSAAVGVGVWEMGNKGAAGIRMGIGEGEEETVVTFVSAHLAPMENAWKRRNQDWKSICQGLVFEEDKSARKAASSTSAGAEEEPLLSSTDESESNQQHSLFSPISHVFFAGDLNYRTSDTSPNQDYDYQNWPQLVESVSDTHHYSHLLARDQLTRELRKKATLHLLAESEIDFPPTYKYSKAAQKQVANAPNTRIAETGGEAWLWARHRVPSWCDRVLYLASAPPNVHCYTALPVQPTSDHRPVALSVSIPRKPLQLSAEDVKPPFPVRKDWKAARTTARQYELAVGIAAYLTLTWEGEAMVAGTLLGLLGGYLVLRAIIGT